MTVPDLNLLIALDALLAEVSVASAARRLGLSASAMSRTLSRLRETTGDPLLVRAGRRMVLTPHAEQLRTRSRDAVDEARTLLSPATSSPDFATLRRTFTFRANDGFVDAFGASLIAALTQAAPFVSLRFLSKAEKTAMPLRGGEADLEIGVLGGIGEASNMGPEIRVQTLFRDHFVGVVRSDHPLVAHGTPDAERYVAFGHVVASRHGVGRGPVDVALEALGLHRDIVAVVPSFLAALSVAQASDLIALVPASLMRQRAAQRVATSSASVQVFDLPVTTGQIAVSLMWHPRMDADPVHRWLRQQVLSVCRPDDAASR